MEGIGKTDIKEISFENRKLLKMMNENSRKVGKHYEVPLPLKNPVTTKLPNNKRKDFSRIQISSQIIRDL